MTRLPALSSTPPTPPRGVAVRDGYFYGLDDGLLACVEVESGERKWKGGRYGSGQTLLVDDLVLIQTESGSRKAVAAASISPFRALARPSWISVATRSRDDVAGGVDTVTGMDTPMRAGGFAAGSTAAGGRSPRASARAPIPTTITKVPKIRH